MSEIERTIGYLEFLKEVNVTPSIDIKLSTAIEALQEKAEREKGCIKCGAAELAEFKFCPECGKKLGE